MRKQNLPKNLRQMIDTYKESVRDSIHCAVRYARCNYYLSNFGTITGRYATPIIVPPTVAIFGCGRSREVPMVRNGQMMIGRMLPLSLTFDHRAVTGGEATDF